MLFDGLAFVEEEDGHGRADDQDEGCHAGEEAQDDQEGAEDFGEDDEDQGPAVTDVERVEEDALLVAKMHQFGKAVIYADQQAECQSEEEGGDVEAGFGIGSGQKFLHSD